MLVLCWTSVAEDGATLSQHCLIKCRIVDYLYWFYQHAIFYANDLFCFIVVIALCPALCSVCISIGLR